MQEIFKYWRSNPRVICGVMTGTSLDGIDIAIAKFSNSNQRHSFELLLWETLPYPEKLKELAFKLINEKITIGEVSDFNVLIAKAYSQAILEAIDAHRFELSEIDAVSVHGQTVYHNPPSKVQLQVQTASTLQLCSLSTLSHLLGKPVLGDFRAADLIKGGEGAPLVPIFDYEFLKSDETNVIALNIGGISNITYIPKSSAVNEIVAFDTGPGNVLIDIAIKHFFNQNYDIEGQIANSGKVNVELLSELKSIDFIFRKPPKSTGRELFSHCFFKELIEKYESIVPNDLITTITEFTAWSIAENIRLFAESKSKIIVSGGGSKNRFLIRRLKELLSEADIISSEQIGIPSDAKEAICWAYLAYRSLCGLPSTIPNVTGAENSAILGQIAFP